MYHVDQSGNMVCSFLGPTVHYIMVDAATFCLPWVPSGCSHVMASEALPDDAAPWQRSLQGRIDSMVEASGLQKAEPSLLTLPAI